MAKLVVGLSKYLSFAAKLLVDQSLLLPDTSLPKAVVSAKSKCQPVVP